MKSRLGSLTQPRLSAVLIALALVPLFGLTAMAGLQVSAALTAQSKFNEVEVATNELLGLVEVEVALVDESYWSEAARLGTELGVPTEFASAVLGVNLDAEHASAIEQTNEALARLDSPAVTRAVEEARNTEVEGRLTETPLTEAIEGTLRSELQRQTTTVIRLASELDTGASVVYSTEVLQRSNAQRTTLSDIVGAYLLLLGFGEADGNTVYRELAGKTSSYEANHIELAQMVSVSPRFEAVWAKFTSDEATTELLAEADRTLRAGPASDQDQRDRFSLSELERTAMRFTLALEATSAHRALVDDVGNELRADLDGLQKSTQRQAQLFIAAGLIIALMSAGAVVVATRSIVRPLADLYQSATALGAGDTTVEVSPRGPREIQAIAHTLNDAKANLHRAEDQALALAAGRLDDASLTEPVAGSLGRSLDSAVHRLRTTLEQGEAYRDRLAYEADHDGLTRLPNRRASVTHLERELERTARTQTELAVLFIDLDGFKGVNDLGGHPAGDQVLIQVSEALSEAVRPDDLVGRVGGDEFLVVAEIGEGEEEAMGLARRLLDAVRASANDDGPQLTVDASIGVVVANEGQNADQLVRDADLALYAAKDAGRGCIRFCDAHLRGRADSELELTRAIQRGLAQGEFLLQAQPIIDATTGSPGTVEALLRWNRPGLGPVSPDQVIDHAERSDLILEIDRWVIRESLRRLRTWEDDAVMGELSIAVNVSGRHLFTGDLVGEVRTGLEETGIDPSKLVLEITEGAMLFDLDTAVNTLDRLRALGVEIAIDDFGTGYTSLTHLRTLQADVLKVDRSFTHNLGNIDDLSLVKMIIETGHILGLRVTIEGVETEAQEELLQTLGADALQGYRYSKPVPIDALPAVIADLAATPAVGPPGVEVPGFS